jgi:hypothetical protein
MADGTQNQFHQLEPGYRGANLARFGGVEKIRRSIHALLQVKTLEDAHEYCVEQLKNLIFREQ